MKKGMNKKTAILLSSILAVTSYFGYSQYMVLPEKAQTLDSKKMVKIFKK